MPHRERPLRGSAIIIGCNRSTSGGPTDCSITFRPKKIVTVFIGVVLAFIVVVNFKLFRVKPSNLPLSSDWTRRKKNTQHLHLLLFHVSYLLASYLLKTHVYCLMKALIELCYQNRLVSLYSSAFLRPHLIIFDGDYLFDSMTHILKCLRLVIIPEPVLVFGMLVKKCMLFGIRNDDRLTIKSYIILAVARDLTSSLLFFFLR